MENSEEDVPAKRTRSSLYRERVEENGESSGSSENSGGRKRKSTTKTAAEKILEEENIRLKALLEENRQILENTTQQMEDVRHDYETTIADFNSQLRMHFQAIAGITKDLAEIREINDAEKRALLAELATVKEKLTGRIDSEVKLKTEALLEEERQNTVFYRTKMLELMEQMQIEQVAAGAPMPWKYCERCRTEFNNERKNKPVLLTGCGHTICAACASMLLKSRNIKCPFDKQLTSATNVDSLPVNKTLLNL